MAGFVNKLKEIVGMIEQPYDEVDDIIDDLENEYEYETEDSLNMDHANTRRRPNMKVLTHPSSGSYEVMVIEPRSFDESLEIVNNLRDRKSVILNLHLLDAEQSQRVVDFLAGATHAVDGHQQRIGEGVFIFTPNNVNISSETEKTRIIRDAFWNQPR